MSTWISLRNAGCAQTNRKTPCCSAPIRKTAVFHIRLTTTGRSAILPKTLYWWIEASEAACSPASNRPASAVAAFDNSRQCFKAALAREPAGAWYTRAACPRVAPSIEQQHSHRAHSSRLRLHSRSGQQSRERLGLHHAVGATFSKPRTRCERAHDVHTRYCF